MPEIGIPELIIILVIVLILFGPGRLSGTGAAVGQAIREFRRGVQGEDEKVEAPPSDPVTPVVKDTPEDNVPPSKIEAGGTQGNS